MRKTGGKEGTAKAIFTWFRRFWPSFSDCVTEAATTYPHFPSAEAARSSHWLLSWCARRMLLIPQSRFKMVACMWNSKRCTGIALQGIRGLLLLACCVVATNAASNSSFDAPFSSFLVADKFPAAVQSASRQFQLGSGKEANVSALSEVIDTASVDFGDLDQASQPVYARAFGQFIHQLLSAPAAANQSNLVQAFANSIVSALTQEGSYSYMRSNYRGPLTELTHAAGLEQSFVKAFTQFKDLQQTVQAAESELSGLQERTGPLLGNYTLTPAVLASLRAAAAIVYGANSQTLTQAKGNTTALASLLFGTAYLAQGDITAAAKNLSASVASSGLPASVQQQAFSEAVQYALQFGRDQGSPSIHAVTVLVAAVISAQRPEILPDSFAQANMVPLNVFCAVARSAQNVSSAAGQAFLNAIPEAFGSRPCDFFQAHGELLYTDSFSTVPPTCNTSPSGPAGAPTEDCNQAIATLMGNSTQCIVPPSNANDPETNRSFSTNQQATLVTAGNCTIVLGGPSGTTVLCSRVGEFAEQIVKTCGTAQQVTGGSYTYQETSSGISPYINVWPSPYVSYRAANRIS